MEQSYFALIIIVGLLAISEISTLKKNMKKQEERINQLAKLTGHEYLSSNWISDELYETVRLLKQSGKKVEAVKKIREHTQMTLVEAKQYVDDLN
ncbi:hypothetical protein [Anaerotignum sp.]|uniref:hypothetical protein n=1 Tax=Anaerotignum sp. TaxID=2039241 RepID=UPI0027149CB1|nr:hypothetical protein [Anaerotignum sp.]